MYAFTHSMSQCSHEKNVLNTNYLCEDFFFSSSFSDEIIFHERKKEIIKKKKLLRYVILFASIFDFYFNFMQCPEIRENICCANHVQCSIVHVHCAAGSRSVVQHCVQRVSLKLKIAAVEIRNGMMCLLIQSSYITYNVCIYANANAKKI